MKNSLIFSLAIFLFFGCATQAQKQYEAMGQAFNNAKENYLLCRNNINSNQSVKYVHENIVLENDNSLNKYQLLSSTIKINEEMKAHLLTYLDEVNKCRYISAEGLSKVHSSFVTVNANADRGYDILYGKFLSGEINIGELNRLLQEARHMQEKEWNQAVNNLELALENQHNNEILNRQRAAAALQNLSIQQQQIQQNQMLYNNLNRPRTTNCNMIGNYVNCTSY